MVEQPRERLTTRREQLVQKVCPECGITFWGLSRQLYHDNDCAQRAAYRRNAEKRRVGARKRYEQRKQEASGR
jgi:hypothetical protein